MSGDIRKVDFYENEMMASKLWSKKQQNGDIETFPSLGKVSSDASVYISSEDDTAVNMRSGLTSVYLSSDDAAKDDKNRSGVTSVYMSSEEYSEYNCDPCKSVGDHTDAEGFCTVCKEYLCSTCFRSHSRSKLSQHHLLLGKDNMPRNSNTLCNRCMAVGIIEGAVEYCGDCGDFLCFDCFRCHPTHEMSKKHEVINDGKIIDEVDFSVAASNKDITGDKNKDKGYSLVRELNVLSDKDKKDCYITDMTLINENELVLCDNDNQSLKQINIDNNIIKNVLVLNSKPYGLTTISKDLIAVVSNNTLQFVTVGENMTVGRTIKTNGQCGNAKFVNKHLYLSFRNPTKFRILKLTGAKVKTIKPDAEVLQHCTLPLYFTVNDDESVIYVSDWETKNVLALNMDGKMLALCQEILEQPLDITFFSQRSIYVCNRNQHTVYGMNLDLREAKEILGPLDGLTFPEAICFGYDKRHLYISSGSSDAKCCNVIKCYTF